MARTSPKLILQRGLFLCLLVMALAVSACTYRFHMKIDGPLEAPTVTPLSSGLFARDGACLHQFVVADAADPEASVWAVSKVDDACVFVDHITYGELPEGFEEASPPMPLAAGVVYVIGPNLRGPPLAEVAYLDGHWQRLD